MPPQPKRYPATPFWALLSLVSACAPGTAIEPGETPADPPGIGVAARSADAFTQSIGLNLHISYFQSPYGTGWETIVKPRLLALGVRHVRDAGAVSSNDGWMQTVYGRMNELAASGIRFNLVLKPAEGSTSYSSATHIDRLLQYARPAVESFEGLNEHDLSGRSAWATEVRTFQQAIWSKLKGNSSTAGLPIFGPSLGNPGNASSMGDLSGYLEYGALHPYPGGLRPLEAIATHVTYGTRVSGSRPMVVTESGYHTATLWGGEHPPVSEAAMGRYVPRLFLDYFNAGFAKSYLYELVDEGASMSSREQAFGLVRSDGTRKPAYTSLQNLIAVLSDPGPAFTPGSLSLALTGDTTNVRRLLLQKRNGRFFLVLWHDAYSFTVAGGSTPAPSSNAVTLTLARPAARIRSFATLTSSAVKTEWLNKASVGFTVPDSPLVLEISP